MKLNKDYRRMMRASKNWSMLRSMKEEEKMILEKLGIFYFLLVLVFFLVLLSGNVDAKEWQAGASTISSSMPLSTTQRDEMFVMAIIGEASNQPFEGQVAIGCAIINRFKIQGNFDGIYGLNSSHIAKEPPSTWETAREAYRSAKSLDATGDCFWFGDSWENVKEFGNPNWDHPVFYMQTVFDHRFYWRLKEGD